MQEIPLISGILETSYDVMTFQKRIFKSNRTIVIVFKATHNQPSERGFF